MNGWLFIHFVGVILFVGNIVTAAFWKLRADRTGNVVHIHETTKNVMLADWLFTLPGVLLISLSGSLMARQIGMSDWLTTCLILFSVSGIVWGAVLIPVQRKLVTLSRQAVIDGHLPANYKRVSRLWNMFGTASTLLPIVVLYVMIFK